MLAGYGRLGMLLCASGLVAAGCFTNLDPSTLNCSSSAHCPSSYVCTGVPGKCVKAALDGGAGDGLTSSPEAGGPLDTRTVDTRALDGAGNPDLGAVGDGQGLDLPADRPLLGPDTSSNDGTPEGSSPETTTDAPLQPDAIDGGAGTGGIVGSGGAPASGGAMGAGGATGTGGATGAGGSTGVCKSRDCTSSNDNDCNGLPDNQEPACKVCPVGTSQSCTAGLGICAPGSQICQLAADHQSVGWGPCTQTVAKRSRDCTSSNDNDCNGQPDNTESTYCQCLADTGSRSCSTGLLGICAAGTQTCVVSADKTTSAWGTCTQLKAKGTETCANPGTDDDCNGVVDDVPVSVCNVGTGLGACANGGNTACSGTTPVCNPAVAGIGDPNAWHLTAAPNGSWDWNCDGYVTKQYGDTAPPPPSCTGLDITACGNVTPVTYSLNGALACGEVGDIGSNYCYWLAAIPACQPKTGQQSGQQQGCH